MSQCPPAVIALPTRHVSKQLVVAIVAVTIFAALSLACAILSEGFVAADACTHYLYAKYAWTDPINLVDGWARPFCTALYALPAHWGGRLGVRVVSLGIAITCAFIAYGIAKGQGLRWPVLALMFALASPLGFVYSFGEMTELPFAMLLGGAFWAYQQRQWFWAALLVGLAPLARPEGLGFVILAAVALVLHRKSHWLLVLVLPLLAWDLAGWLITHRPDPWWRWLYDAWPWSSGSLYGRGNPLVLIAVLPIIVTPLAVPAMFIGLGQSLRGARESNAGPHLRACRLLTAAIPLAVLAVHGVLRWTGRMGSLGEPRYLLTAAPFWALLTARGWEWVFARANWKGPLFWTGAAAMAPLVVNAILPAVPIPLAPDWKTARQFAQWYASPQARSLRRQYPNVIASHPGVFYFLNENPTGKARRGGFTRGIITAPPPGTLLVWDPIYALQNANFDDVATLATIERAGWSPDASLDQVLNAPDPSHPWHVFHSPAPVSP